MTGLIYKDLINLKAYGKSLIGMMVVFLAVAIMNKSAVFFFSFIQMLSIIVTISTFGYDERGEWDHYAMSLPIKRSDIVKSKYIFACCAVVFTSLIGVISAIILSFSQNQSLMVNEYLFSILLVGSIVCVVLALTIPFAVKYGSEKSRFAMMSLLVIPFGLVALMDTIKISMTWLIDLLNILTQYPFVLPGLCILSLFISYLISNQIYNKKEF